MNKKIINDDYSLLGEAIVKDIKRAPVGQRRALIDGKIKRIGENNKNDCIKYLSRISSPTGVGGSLEHAKIMLKQCSDNMHEDMSILISIIDSCSMEDDDIKMAAENKLGDFSEFSAIMIQALMIS